MNRKTTLFALGPKCGGRGASGLATDCGLTDSCAATLPKKPSSESSAASATPVKPAPASQRNSRRVRPQKLPCGMRIFNLPLIKIHELIQIQHQQTEQIERPLRRRPVLSLPR